jgi:hypothetical protein
MRGEAVTVDSIKNYFESEEFKENANKVGSKFSEIFLIFVKIFFAFWGVIAAIVGFAVILGIMIAAVALIASGSWFVFNTGIISMIFWSAVAGVVLIPAIGMFVGGIRMIKNHKVPQNMQKRSGVFGWLMFALWVISLLILIASATYNRNDFEYFGDRISEKWENRINHKIGNQITESRAITAFNAVEIGNAIDVEFVNSDSLFVDITAGEKIINNIETEVRNGVLHIKYKQNRRNGSIHAKIGIGKLNSIVAQNACNIIANDTIFGENLTMKFANACDINIYAKANDIKLDCGNAVDADFDFTANSVNMKFSNACDVDGKIKATSIFADFSNACDVDFNVNSELLQINADNACDIDIEGVTNRLITKKGAASSINTENLRIGE